MIENPVYLPKGHEECTIPGWYFVNEADIYEGPYLTETATFEAKQWYYDIYLNGLKGK